jgi:DUF971 family protein
MAQARVLRHLAPGMFDYTTGGGFFKSPLRAAEGPEPEKSAMTDIKPATRPWPTELRLSRDKRLLTVQFDDGSQFALPAEYLRVVSPSAEVQGHSPEQRQTVPGKRDVQILEVNPVGNYAVRLMFDDLHSTGIYGWDYLHEIGSEQAARWQAYLDELAAKGLSREPVRR